MMRVRVRQGLAAAVIVFFVAPFVAPFVASAAAGEKSYKWTDDEGNVHYGDTIPPEHSDKRRQVIDERGMVEETIEPAASQEDRDKARQQARRDRRDRMLLDSYSSADELIRDRAQLFEALQKQIRLIDKSAREEAAKLEQLRADARERRESGRPVPKELKAQLESTRAALEDRRKAKEMLKEQLENKRQQFVRDLERYRQLTRSEEARAANE